MKGRLFQLLYYGLPALVIAVSVLALNSGPLLKRPIGNHGDVPAQLEALLPLAEAERWADAKAAAERVGADWERLRRRIHLTSARDEVETFDLELAALRGAIEAGDAALTRVAVRRLLALWADLGA